MIVPDLSPPESFEAHYRDLILTSARRSAVFESQLQRALGHRLRAQRAERRALELALISGETEPTVAGARRGWEGPRRGAVAVSWLASLALLIGALAVFGIRSWEGGLADLALIALSFAWFLADAHGSHDRRPASSEPAPEGRPASGLPAG